jgi:hypothetical protein
LSRNVIYINGNRVTDKQTLPSKERVADSNIFNIEFKVAVDYNEPHTSTLQLFPTFDIIGKYPLGTYTLASLGNDIIGSFNRLYSLGSGTVRLYKDNTLLKTYVVAEITESGFDFLADISSTIVANGSYYINIDSGLFISDFNEVYQGISNTTDWSFEVSSGAYDNASYSNDYLIN